METKESKESLYVLLALSIMSMKVVLNTSSIVYLPDIIDNSINIIVVLLMLPKIIATRYKSKEFLYIILLGLLFLLIAIKTKELIILCSFLTLLAVQNMDFIKIVKSIHYSKLYVVLIHFILFFITYFIDKTNLLSTYNYANQLRYTFFFENPNSIAGLMFWIISERILLCYYNKKSNNINRSIWLIGLGIFAFVVYKFTLSRTFLMNVVFLYVLLILAKSKKVAKILKISSKYILLVLFLFSLFLAYKYNSSSTFYLNIDNILSRRVSLGSIALSYYGVNMFPATIDYDLVVGIPNLYYMHLVIDNIYIRFAVSYGILSFLCLYYLLYKFVCKKHNIILYIFIIMLAINGFTENYMINVYIAFPLLFASKVFIKEEENE